MTQPTPAGPLIAVGMERQLAVFHEALSRGMPRVGWKIGINDPTAQQRMGIEATLVGWLDGRRLFGEGEPYQPQPGARPRMEAEVAVRLSAPVPAGASLDFARAAIGAISPAIEFVDVSKPVAPLDELLAHDILHDGVAFGDEAGLGAAAGLVHAGFPTVSLNGVPVRQGLAGRYPEDLAEIVAHVANVLDAHGEALAAGDRIICGSYIDPFDVASGDRVEADFGPLGRMAFTVA